MNQSAYQHLVEALEQDPENLPDDPAALKRRLVDAGIGLRLLLLAWARFEDEQPPERRMEIQDIRTDWGRYADKFMRSTP